MNEETIHEKMEALKRRASNKGELIGSSAEELFKRLDDERAARLKKGRWGAWYLCDEGKSLGINRAYRYEFEIADQSPLHWFAHLRQKTWLQRGDAEDLMAAFDDIFNGDWLEEATEEDEERQRKIKGAMALLEGK